MARILFWDIDGTLLTTRRAGVFALEQAAIDVCDAAPDFAELQTAGLTDHEVATLALESVGADATPELAAAFLRAYEGHLPERLGLRAGGPMTNVVEILTALREHEDVVSLLLTGNTEAGARAKLAHYELAEFFAAGAFCTAGDDRLTIARRAVEVAAEVTGGPVDPAATFVIGDTPHDVRCGKAIGARTVAVATGPTYSVAELSESEPWVVLESLPEPDAFLALLERP
jgi:phosphoglycolate phosphatase-like HAD superfamily hydrolase